MRLVRIREAKPLSGYRVELTLTDGRAAERDLGPMLVGPVFAEVRKDEARFREMQRRKRHAGLADRRRLVPGYRDLERLYPGRRGLGHRLAPWGYGA